MKSNLEIEFKTFITKENYELLLKKFNLEDKVSMQTNHYFDNTNNDLSKNKTVLRIRQKGNKYKLTSKQHSNQGDLETHLPLTQDEATNMFLSGFDANIININTYVNKVCELSTYRVSMPFNDGEIFFDKSIYYGNIDYEIEYEANSFEQGQKDFDLFLAENNIEFVKAIKKSERAYNSVKK